MNNFLVRQRKVLFKKLLEGRSAQARAHKALQGQPKYDHPCFSPEAQQEIVSVGQLHLADMECAEILAALDRLRRGEYGICADCGEEISRKRLEAVPWTTRCLACQEQKEAARIIPSTRIAYAFLPHVVEQRVVEKR